LDKVLDKVQFHHLYEYLKFEPGEAKPELFQLDKALTCHVADKDHPLSYWLGNVQLANKPMRAAAYFNPTVGWPRNHGVAGYAAIVQDNADAPAVVELVLAGLKGDSAVTPTGERSEDSGFADAAVHKDGVAYRLYEGPCQNLGPIWDPAGVRSKDSMDYCSVDGASACAAGDLSCKHGQIRRNNFISAFVDAQLQLYNGQQPGAIGKSLALFGTIGTIPNQLLACTKVVDADKSEFAEDAGTPVTDAALLLPSHSCDNPDDGYDGMLSLDCDVSIQQFAENSKGVGGLAYDLQARYAAMERLAAKEAKLNNKIANVTARAESRSKHAQKHEQEVLDQIAQARLDLEKAREQQKDASLATLKVGSSSNPGGVAQQVKWGKGLDSACIMTKCYPQVTNMLSDPALVRALACAANCEHGWSHRCVFSCAVSHDLTLPTVEASAQMAKFLDLEACVEGEQCIDPHVSWSFGVNSHCADDKCTRQQQACLASEGCRAVLACAKTPPNGHWSPEYACSCANRAVPLAELNLDEGPTRAYYQKELERVLELMEELGHDEEEIAKLGIDTAHHSHDDREEGDARQVGVLSEYKCLADRHEGHDHAQDDHIGMLSKFGAHGLSMEPKELYLDVIECLVLSTCTDEGREQMVSTLALSDSFGQGVDSRCVHRHCAQDIRVCDGTKRCKEALNCAQDCSPYSDACVEECASRSELDDGWLAEMKVALDELMAAYNHKRQEQGQMPWVEGGEGWGPPAGARAVDEDTWPGSGGFPFAEFKEYQERSKDRVAFFALTAPEKSTDANTVHNTQTGPSGCIVRHGCRELVWAWEVGVECMHQHCLAQQAVCIHPSSTCVVALKCAQQHCAPWTQECGSGCREQTSGDGGTRYDTMIKCMSSDHDCVFQAPVVKFEMRGDPPCKRKCPAQVGPLSVHSPQVLLAPAATNMPLLIS
jgi:hypothetical protein